MRSELASCSERHAIECSWQLRISTQILGVKRVEGISVHSPALLFRLQAICRAWVWGLGYGIQVHLSGFG